MTEYVGGGDNKVIVVILIVGAILIIGAFFSAMQSRAEWNALTPQQRCAVKQQDKLMDSPLECTTIDRFKD